MRCYLVLSYGIVLFIILNRSIEFLLYFNRSLKSYYRDFTQPVSVKNGLSELKTKMK